LWVCFPASYWEMQVKIRLDRLVAATALGLSLALASQSGQAQQADSPTSETQVVVPVPDTTTAAKDVDASEPAVQSETTASIPKPATDVSPVATESDTAATAKDEATSEPTKDAAIPAAEPKSEPSQDAATPAAAPRSEPTQDAATPAAAPKSEPSQNAATPAAAPKSEPSQNAATPAAAPKSEPTQDATVPAAEPVKDASTPAAAPTVRSALAERLRELIEARLDRYVSRKADREGVEAYYKAHDYKPLWVTDSGANDRAKAAIAFLQQVETVGLDSRDYPTPDFSADSLAADELKLTNSVLTYARHAEIGRTHFTRVAADILFKLNPPDPAEVLAKLAEADDAAKALDSYNPPQPGFKALKLKLAELRSGLIAKAQAEEPKHVRVPGGRILRPGMRDKRVVILRERLDVAGDKESPLYDEDVIDAVKAFQTQADIGVDGMVGPNTVAALNGEKVGQRTPADPIDTVIVNMERWRWLPRKLGNKDGTYVVVNVPDYSLSLMHNGKLFWKTRIVVGKPGNATPMTSAEMKYITVNPTWNVPPSIIENEYLPALEQDPTVLDRYGLKIRQDPDGTIHIYQPPGAGNALGRIRFNFPNKFLVYQHDTPDKYLFKRPTRAYSHGCMRVQNPIEYAEKLLSLELPQENYTKRKIESMFGTSEININLPKPIPVHLTYQTAFVDEDGNLQFRDDVYRRDARMIQILKGSERKIADIAIDHPPDTSAKPVRMPAGMFSDYNDGYYGRYSGPGFFDWLFGGPGGPPEPPRYQRIYRPRGFIGPRTNNTGRYSRR